MSVESTVANIILHLVQFCICFVSVLHDYTHRHWVSCVVREKVSKARLFGILRLRKSLHEAQKYPCISVFIIRVVGILTSFHVSYQNMLKPYINT